MTAEHDLDALAAEPIDDQDLRALAGLQAAAAEIGEDEEAERCALFLRQLDPGWPPADFDA